MKNPPVLNFTVRRHGMKRNTGRVLLPPLRVVLDIYEALLYNGNLTLSFPLMREKDHNFS